MTNTDGTKPRNVRLPRSNPMDRDNPANRTHIQNRTAQLQRWDTIVGTPSRFVRVPPLKFHYETDMGDTITVRLVLNTEDQVAWHIEIPYSDTMSEYYTLYYWRRACYLQHTFNTIHLLANNLRWSDNMTHTRYDDTIDTYNPLLEMLEAIGIDIGETISEE